MFKFIKGLITFVLVIVIVIGIGLVVVANLTPRHLGLTQLNIGGKTIEELGLSDTKLKDIYKAFNSLSDGASVVDNPYDEQKEQQQASDNMQGSTMTGDNYMPLLTDKVVYDKQYVKVYKDTTLAYIFNNIVESASGEEGAISQLRELDVKIRQLTISLENDSAFMRVIGEVSVADYKEQIKQSLGALASFVKIPDSVFIVCDYALTADSEGAVHLETLSYSINGQENDPVINALLDIAQSSAGLFDVQQICNQLGEAISTVIGNLGLVAQATAGTDGSATEIVYGMGGVADGSLTVVTHTA